MVKKLTKRLKNNIRRTIHKPWYPYWIAFLAAIDMYVSIIPTDIILFTTIFLKPRKWIQWSLVIGLGSVLGGLSICLLFQSGAETLTETLFPNVFSHPNWKSTESFFQNYGLWAVFLTGLGPIPQQFTLIIASIAKTPIFPMIMFYALGRIIKFLIYGWVASHAPSSFKMIQKEWETFQKSPKAK